MYVWSTTEKHPVTSNHEFVILFYFLIWQAVFLSFMEQLAFTVHAFRGRYMKVNECQDL